MERNFRKLVTEEDIVNTVKKAKLNDISSLVDKNGHNRFIEDNGNVAEITGFEGVYCKWSLSGTHLMLVLAGNIQDTTVLSTGTVLVEFNLPSWIRDKIYPIVSNLIEYKNATAVSSNYSSQTLLTYLNKSTDGVRIYVASTFTATADRTFRIEYDLLIDNE